MPEGKNANNAIGTQKKTGKKDWMIGREKIMAFVDKIDAFYAAVAGFIVLIGFLLVQTGQIHSNALVFALFLMALIPALRLAVPFIMEYLLQKKIYGKGLHDYWQDFSKQADDCIAKYDFSFPIIIPPTYFPTNAIPLDQFGLVLFEINRDDLRMQEEMDYYKEAPYFCFTILLRINTGAFFGILRNRDLDDAMLWVEAHEKLFLGEQKAIIPFQSIQPQTYLEARVEKPRTAPPTGGT